MPNSALEQQLRARGLEVMGACSDLSQCREVMNSALLQEFTREEADLLGASMLRVRAQPGQLLIEEGETSDWMMLLISGTVDVGKRKIGAASDDEDATDTTRIAVIKEGAVVGEMSMLDGEPRYASCHALSVVEAAVLSRPAVSVLISKHPAVGAKLLVKLTQLLAQRLRNTGNQLVKALQQLGAVSARGPGTV